MIFLNLLLGIIDELRKGFPINGLVLGEMNIKMLQ
jgi:hypothetical protein